MKKNITIFSLLLAATATTLPGEAKTLSPSEAIGRLHASSSARRLIAQGEGLRLVHTALVPESDIPAFYVFDKADGGYIILSADDRLADILADIDSGHFELSTLPANMKWWLGEYKREIAEALSFADTYIAPESSTSSKVIMQDTRHDVEPLLTTKWDQDAPYNDLCPSFGDDKAMTGCVATAMAQIIRYHEWPSTHGFGSNTYTYRGRTYSFDFEKTTFDWNNMKNDYSSTSGSIITPEEIQAVANLMYACGVGVNMEYGPEESGAVSYRIAPALRDYFGYPECTSLVIRDTYSLWEWEELMYQEMAGGRPVCYSGIGGMGGHQFVLDGYRADNMFHINWGWSGVSDGYFRLTSLNPSILGIGGGGGSFNYLQEAVVRCCRPENAAGLEPITPVYIKGDFIMTSIQNPTDEGCVIEIAFNNGGMYANSVNELPGQFGILLTDKYENEIGYFGYMDVKFPAATSQGLYGYHYASAYVPRPENPGIYRVYPAFCPEGGKWTRIPTYNGGNRFINLSVDEERKMTFGNDGLTILPELEIMNLVIKSDIYSGVPTTILVDALNGPDAYNGELHLYLQNPVETDNNGDSDELPALPIDSKYLEIPANMYDLYSMEVTFNQAPGEYEVYFADCLNRRISSNFPITVKEYTEDTAVGSLLSDIEAPTEWYDLQGRKLNGEPSAPGLYIERKGNLRHKVLKKY
ncbi:MAG: hypothetical protein HDS82_01300 [Bacteroidales bacterium]|nr:hypothetical protein [Bacteroidales bacterium]